MMSRTLSLAVAGAGIGGLAAASLLMRQGHRVTVFDQFEAAGPVGSGLMLQETGLVILAQLGLRERAEALGAPVTRLWGISSETGRAVLDVRYEALRAGLRGIGIQRAALRLARDAAQLPNAVTEKHFDELRQYFDDGELVEIVAVISLFAFLNSWNDTMATPLENPPITFAQEHLTGNGWAVGKHA